MNIEKIKAAALAATHGEWKTMRRGDEDWDELEEARAIANEALKGQP